MDERHITHHEEMMFLKENQKRMKPREAKSYWSVVRKELENDIKMHELYVLVKDRVERYGGK